MTTIFGLLISFIACTANVLILKAICEKHTLHSVTNYFLASLAVGDFFVGIVALPLWITRSLLAVADEEHPLSISVDCVYVLSVGISTYNLCTISLERYVGVILPLQYNAIVTTRRFRYAVVTTWVISSSIATLRWAMHEDTYWIIAVSTVFIIPGVVISYCYICIFKEASRQSRAIGQQTGSDIANHAVKKQKGFYNDCYCYWRVLFDFVTSSGLFHKRGGVRGGYFMSGNPKLCILGNLGTFLGLLKRID